MKLLKLFAPLLLVLALTSCEKEFIDTNYYSANEENSKKVELGSTEFSDVLAILEEASPGNVDDLLQNFKPKFIIHDGVYLGNGDAGTVNCYTDNGGLCGIDIIGGAIGNPLSNSVVMNNKTGQNPIIGGNVVRKTKSKNGYQLIIE